MLAHSYRAEPPLGGGLVYAASAVPDWSYRTFIKPLLFGLPGDWGQRVCLRSLAALSRLPLGPGVIQFFGHMSPPARLAKPLGNWGQLTSPIGLGSGVDPQYVATGALAHFGFGWIYVGPVEATPVRGPSGHVESAISAQHSSADRVNGVFSVHEALSVGHDLPPHVWPVFEITSSTPDANSALANIEAALRDLHAGLQRSFLAVLPPGAAHLLTSGSNETALMVRGTITRFAHPVLMAVPQGEDMAVAVDIARRAGLAGVYVASAHEEPRLVASPHSFLTCLSAVRCIRQVAPSDFIVAVDAAIESPRQALHLKDAGADLLAISSGLVHTGPGLPKRCNEALFESLPTHSEAQANPTGLASSSHERMSWFWGMLLGLGMGAGALLTAWVALTSVVLPYDEVFLGLRRDDIAKFNHRLLHFMAHDRLTLAGTMASIACFYGALSWFGIRRGQLWARHVIAYSGLVGFFTFFAFLGFGYLDPLHAFVTSVLLQLYLLMIVLPVGKADLPAAYDLDNDRIWAQGLWGQFIFTLHAAALILAGLVITGFGVSVVFVPQDIEYLRMLPDQVASLRHNMLPLVAHDRATFGGMLTSVGVALLLTTMWGYRRGSRWLWWLYAISSFPAYGATLWIHQHIGYVNHFHLAPVYIGLLLLALGLSLSHRFLVAPSR